MKQLESSKVDVVELKEALEVEREKSRKLAKESETLAMELESEKASCVHLLSVTRSLTAVSDSDSFSSKRIIQTQLANETLDNELLRSQLNDVVRSPFFQPYPFYHTDEARS